MTFQINDRVRLLKTSGFYLAGRTGTIINIGDEEELAWPYEVRFDDGRSDVFSRHELEKAYPDMKSYGELIVETDHRFKAVARALKDTDMTPLEKDLANGFESLLGAIVNSSKGEEILRKLFT